MINELPPSETYTELLEHMRVEHQPPTWVLADCAPPVLTEVHQLDHEQRPRDVELKQLTHIHSAR